MKDAAASRVETHHLGDDGTIPNNEDLPLLVYRDVLPLAGDAAAECERRFSRHGWPAAWRNGVYDYHHYHATVHEALGFVRGSAQVRFGGARGTLVEVKAGDVVVIPAGVGHKRESASPDLMVIGAYPGGRNEPDICRAEPADREKALARIPEVPVPASDPVFGTDGPLQTHWRQGSGARMTQRAPLRG